MQGRTLDSTAVSIDQQKAIVALLREPSITKAAASLDIDESTLYRWMKEPGFCKEFREARRESFRHAIGMCNRYAPAAVQALMKIVADEKTAPAVKVSAAGLLLKFSRESIELDDLASRIEGRWPCLRACGEVPLPFALKK